MSASDSDLTPITVVTGFLGVSSKHGAVYG